MEFKIPEHIIIGSKKYKIIDLNEDERNDENFGFYECKKGLIKLDLKMKKEEQLTTLFHEILHGFLEHSGLAFFLKEKDEEIIISAIAYRFYEFLIQNNYIKIEEVNESKDWNNK